MPPAGSRAASTPSLPALAPVRAAAALVEPRHAGDCVPSCRPPHPPPDRHGFDAASAAICTDDDPGVLPPYPLPCSNQGIAQASPGGQSAPDGLSSDHPALARDSSTTEVDVFPPPFDAAELEPLDDPVSAEISIYLAFGVKCHLRGLPDGSLDNQAQVLQFIVDTIRKKAMRSAYYFKGRSPKELVVFLQRDPALSNAMRDLYTTDLQVFGLTLILIIRYICRRPPSSKSRKSVHFPQELPTSRPKPPPGNYALYTCDTPQRIPPFDPEAVRHLYNPVGSKMQPLAIVMLMQIQKMENCPDAEVRLFQLLCDVLRNQLVPTHLFADIEESELREAVLADDLLMEQLRAMLLEPNCDMFDQRLALVVRYLCVPLLG